MTAAVLAVLSALAAAPFADLRSGVDVAPAEVLSSIKGRPVAAARWTDKLGLNVVVLSETARVGPASGGTQRLFGHHFVQSRGAAVAKTWRQLWRIADGVFDCEFDLVLRIIAASLTVTDLDGDGTAETTFGYVTGCTSDVSPDALKVLMHEGASKLALRGRTRVQVGEEDGRPVHEGGDRKPDAALARAPAAFLRHAQQVFDRAGGK